MDELQSYAGHSKTTLINKPHLPELMKGVGVLREKPDYRIVLQGYNMLRSLLSNVPDTYKFLTSTIQEYRLLDPPTRVGTYKDGRTVVDAEKVRIAQTVQPGNSEIITPAEYFQRIENDLTSKANRLTLDNLLRIQVLTAVLKQNSSTHTSLTERLKSGKPDLTEAYETASSLVANWLCYFKQFYSHELPLEAVRATSIAEAAGLEEPYELTEARVDMHVFESDKFIAKLLQMSEDTSLKMVLRTSAGFIFG